MKTKKGFSLKFSPIFGPKLSALVTKGEPMPQFYILFYANYTILATQRGDHGSMAPPKYTPTSNKEHLPRLMYRVSTAHIWCSLETRESDFLLHFFIRAVNFGLRAAVLRFSQIFGLILKNLFLTLLEKDSNTNLFLLGLKVFFIAVDASWLTNQHWQSRKGPRSSADYVQMYYTSPCS